MVAWCRRSGRETLAALLVLVGLLIALAHVTGCAAFQKAMPFLPRPADLACVANDVEHDITDPFKIAADCPGLAQTAIADIEALVVDLVASKRAAHRAAAEHGLCDGGAADAGK